MAKKKNTKKSENEAQAPTGSPGGINRKTDFDSVGSTIDTAENGFVIRVTSSGGKKPGYESRTLIAPTHGAALRISNTHLGSIRPKMKGKKGKGKGKSKGKALEQKS